MTPKVTSVKFAGPAGLGIKSIGLLFSKILINHGFFVHDYSEYPSLVRGGHNTYQVSFSSDQIFAPFYKLDYLVAISPNHWSQNASEVKNTGCIFAPDNQPDAPANFTSIPFSQLATEAGSAMSINTVALGVLGYILNFDLKIVNQELTLQYPKAVEINQKAYSLGFAYAQDNMPSLRKNLSKGNNTDLPTLLDGNEAFGWGFLKAGGNFYAAYPMTPATGTLHFLAEKQKDIKGLTVLHPEDEIAAANMILGAAFAGARAATGSSGGGFALMNEAISFAAIAEIGAVYYLVSRPGPATGLPTWTSQGDLLHAIFSGHGEFPLVVLAPGDQAESFELGKQALNLASTLQTPVLVLSDKFAAESASSIANLSEEPLDVALPQALDQPTTSYKRYSTDTTDGVSAYTLPGTPDGEFLANSYEHDETGFSTEDALQTVASVDKRFRKLATAQALVPKAEIYGGDKAKTLIISFGSTKGSILEALRLIDNSDFAFLQLKTLWPIDPNLHFIIDSFKNTIVIENDRTAQLVTILKTQFDFNPTKIITKYDGRPFYPEELAEKIVKISDKSYEIVHKS